jgi:hypothetical protein
MSVFVARHVDLIGKKNVTTARDYDRFGVQASDPTLCFVGDAELLAAPLLSVDLLCGLHA